MEKISLWLIYLCKKNKILSKVEEKTCNKIRKIYNKTKHKLDYRIDSGKLQQLFEDFSEIFIKLN